MNCIFCNKQLSFSFYNSFTHCLNHSIKVKFYANAVEFQKDDYIILLRNNRTNLYLNSTLIISVPEKISVTPESFDSTIQKLLNLKAFL